MSVQIEINEEIFNIVYAETPEQVITRMAEAKKYRLFYNIKQKDISDIMGKTPSWVAQIENLNYGNSRMVISVRSISTYLTVLTDLITKQKAI